MLTAASLLVLATLVLAGQAVAAGAPGDLEGMVTSVVREEARGPVAWARYVETTPELAARLLGKRRAQLFEDVPERVHLVVLHGDFTLPGGGERRAPYLAFLYWPSGDTWQATDFTLLERVVPLGATGRPRTVEPFAVRHRGLDRALLQARLILSWFLPPVLLAACAALCLSRRRARWPGTLALGVIVAVAAWQTVVTLLSLSGQTWDPWFHGAKLALLAVVLIVDLTAASLLWRRRARTTAGRDPSARRAPPVGSVVVVLLLAAAIYVPSLLWLAATGA